MSNTNEILYVTARTEINAKLKILRNLAEAAEKKGVHRSINESGAKIVECLDKINVILGHIDSNFEGIIYLTKKKGNE